MMEIAHSKSVIRNSKVALAITLLVSLLILTSCKSSSVRKVERLIDDIGKVDLNSQYAIEEAQSAYDNLSRSEQKKVSNYSDLEDAIEEFNSFLTIDNYTRYLTIIPDIGVSHFNTGGYSYYVGYGFEQLFYDRVQVRLTTSPESQKYDFDDVVISGVITISYESFNGVPQDDFYYERFGQHYYPYEAVSNGTEEIKVPFTIEVTLDGDGEFSVIYDLPSDHMWKDTWEDTYTYSIQISSVEGQATR